VPAFPLEFLKYGMTKWNLIVAALTTQSADGE
jgi:hypothetical protein